MVKYIMYVTITKTAISTVCQRCLYEWRTTSQRNFVACPSCHTTVSLRKFKRAATSGESLAGSQYVAGTRSSEGDDTRTDET